jgi:hypothetical protein
MERTALATGKKMPPAPLGDTWSGRCCSPQGAWQPDSDTARQLCNFGYARERCWHMPEDGPDAVRFAISHDREGLIRIYWVMEKSHLPFAHGPLAYFSESGVFDPPHTDPCIARQAQAYVSSYLRRKGDAARS